MTNVTSASVDVPGDFYARVGKNDDGTLRVVGLTFMPSGSDAGYFGPSARVNVDEDHVLDGVDLDDVDGPFWRAMQHALATGEPSIEWEE